MALNIPEVAGQGFATLLHFIGQARLPHVDCVTTERDRSVHTATKDAPEKPTIRERATRTAVLDAAFFSGKRIYFRSITILRVLSAQSTHSQCPAVGLLVDGHRRRHCCTDSC